MNNHRFIEKVSLKKKYYLILVVFLILLGLCGCIESKEIYRSNVDKSAGIWIIHNDGNYEYRISKNDKDRIYAYVNEKHEQWRKDKVSVALFYITDIDKSFVSLDSNNVELNLSGDDIIINGETSKYLFVFEEYKGIYFPMNVHVIKKESNN
jgi:hypothetical protein